MEAEKSEINHLQMILVATVTIADSEVMTFDENSMIADAKMSRMVDVQHPFHRRC